MKRTIWCLVVAACGATVAGCSKDDDKTVAGRTVSSSTAPETSWVVELRRERVIEAATSAARASFLIRIEAPEAPQVVLRTPSGEELPLLAGEGEHRLREEGPAEALEARFPPGGYTLLLDLPSGRDATGTLLARPLPAAPTLLAPQDRALVSADEPLLVRWGGEGLRHDLRLVPVAGGEPVWEARGVTGREQRVPVEALTPGARLRVEVLAVDGQGPVRAAAGVAIEVDVAGRGA